VKRKKEVSLRPKPFDLACKHLYFSLFSLAFEIKVSFLLIKILSFILIKLNIPNTLVLERRRYRWSLKCSSETGLKSKIELQQLLKHPLLS